jgi:hypothetical protein
MDPEDVHAFLLRRRRCQRSDSSPVTRAAAANVADAGQLLNSSTTNPTRRITTVVRIHWTTPQAAALRRLLPPVTGSR